MPNKSLLIIGWRGEISTSHCMMTMRFHWKVMAKIVLSNIYNMDGLKRSYELVSPKVTFLIVVAVDIHRWHFKSSLDAYFVASNDF